MVLRRGYAPGFGFPHALIEVCPFFVERDSFVECFSPVVMRRHVLLKSQSQHEGWAVQPVRQSASSGVSIVKLLFLCLGDLFY